MAGFFSKKQYAAMAESELAMKLLKERCLELFNLCDILQLVIDRFCQSAFSQQDFVRYAHQGIFHFVLHFGYQLYATREKILE